MIQKLIQFSKIIRSNPARIYSALLKSIKFDTKMKIRQAFIRNGRFHTRNICSNTDTEIHFAKINLFQQKKGVRHSISERKGLDISYLVVSSIKKELHNRVAHSKKNNTRYAKRIYQKTSEKLKKYIKNKKPETEGKMVLR